MLNPDPKKLIIGESKASKILGFVKDSQTGKYNVTFKDSDGHRSVIQLDKPVELDPSLYLIKRRDGLPFKSEIESIYIFADRGKNHWHICFADQSTGDYYENDLDISIRSLRKRESTNVLSYLHKVATLNNLTSPDGTKLLMKNYKKINFVRSNSALAVYLNPEKNPPQTFGASTLIFPFGCNVSQFKAVKAALENQMSIIQGPPGTGKTQTILNIIANLLLQGKTVQVVSNNNAAIDNVREKLSSPEYEMGFIVAPLGNSKRKEIFIDNQSGEYPDLTSWEDDSFDDDSFLQDIRKRSEELRDIFSKQEHLAKSKLELQNLKTEHQHYTDEINFDLGVTMRETLCSASIMQLWQEFQFMSERISTAGRISALWVNLKMNWLKLKTQLLYGLKGPDLFCGRTDKIILFLQNEFYKRKKDELISEIQQIEKALENCNAKRLANEFSELSMKYLRHKLFQRYGQNQRRTKFRENVFGWKIPEEHENSEEHGNDEKQLNYQDFQAEYPVILSTTFASRSSLHKDAQYDYLIMDEASQVDVATGALALSCAKNAVIVGDTKQLSNIVERQVFLPADAIFAAYNISESYSFAHRSFLQSVCELFPNVPQTLLREHYRCHPKIINFCNQKFYGGQLVIMTKDNGENDVLSVIRTAVGDHDRSHLNQRQINVTSEEVLPKLELDCAPSEIGVIAPYNKQVDAMIDAYMEKGIDVATVHKFQGREKDAIVLTTVDDVITDFTDDPYLLNVAVSRAKKKLCVVVSGNEQPKDSNISDLISYVEYNNFLVTDSKICSIFDYLYSQYTESRIKYLKKHKRVSEFDSENLMYGLITDMLEEMGFLFLGIAVHLPLKMLQHDLSLMNDAERKYVMNGAHIDFLIYNHLTKKPVLAIEVDGYYNHKENDKQAKRDEMKNHILELYEIPYIRLATNGSGEKEKLRKKLESIVHGPRRSYTEKHLTDD